MDWLLALLLGYALGSIPFGLLLAKAAGKGDIRQVGSGNIGATNVLRTGSKSLAAAVLLLDAGKGFVAVWLSLLAITRISSLAGMSAALAAPIAATLLERWEFVPALWIVALIVVIQHRANIARLRAGAEPKIGRKT